MQFMIENQTKNTKYISTFKNVNQKEATVTKSVTVHLEQGRKDHLRANNIEPKNKSENGISNINSVSKNYLHTE